MPLLSGGAGAAALWFQEELWSLPWLNQSQGSTSALETGRLAEREEPEPKRARRAPYLSYKDARAAINQPVEFGIVLNNGTGGEILVLSGFSEGTTFSAGAALGATRWSLPGPDLDQAFVSAPENFSGAMQVMATLYSSSHEILEAKIVRFEWGLTEQPGQTAVTDVTGGTSGPPPESNADDSGQTRLSDTFGSISAGNDAPATTSEHVEASVQDPSPLWLTMVADWLSQVSSISLPVIERPFERAIGSPPSPASSPAGLVETVERLLREGNSRAARPLLRRAADAGSASAAIALARSLDPLFVKQGSAAANPAEAARWYRRGLKLGRKDIAGDLERVTNLIKNPPPPADRDEAPEPE